MAAVRADATIRSMSRVHANASLLLILVAPGLVALMLTAFAWPSARLAPRGLPVGVVGAVRGFPTEGGAFSVHRYPDAATARQAIEHRHVYGAAVASADGTRLLVASAASLQVAQLLERMFAGEARSGPAVRVVDVVPADPQDPRGAALASSVQPLVLAGIASGVLLTAALESGAVLAGALVAAVLLAGLAGAGILQTWLGVIGGSWAANAGVLALIVLAVCATAAGLCALLGRLRGVLLTVLVMIVIGLPFSGVSSAPELLPRPTGTIGQLLPPGAGGNLLRSTAFFNGAGAGSHLAVLAVWAGLGLAAVIAAARLTPRRAARGQSL